MMAEWTDRPESTTGLDSAGTGVYWDYGYFQWKFNNQFAVAVGRQQVIAAQNLFWTNGGYDGVQFMFGAPSDKFQAKVGYGDVGTYNSYGITNPLSNVMSKELLLVDATYKFSNKVSANGALYWALNTDKLQCCPLPQELTPTAIRSKYGNSV